MALTGHLSDLSLSELIEFFCNQRKTGHLRVLYPKGAGCFNLQNGSVVDAKIGVLRGIDAVYYALTLPNAVFEFRATTETSERTINQPWIQVVLEGLRRLDEGFIPPEAFPAGFVAQSLDMVSLGGAEEASSAPAHVWHVPAFLSMMSRESLDQRKPFIASAVAAAVIVSVAAIGVPAGWYGRSKAVAAKQPSSAAPSQPQPAAVSEPATAKPAETEARTPDAVALEAKRQREKERSAKAREERANAIAGHESPKRASSPVSQNASSDTASKPGPKKATVQVTYDESGRVTQASGADSTALRIARQKRFPPGKAGTATITIPIN